MVARHTYPMPTKENVVPGSDMAGEIVVVGEEVPSQWSVGMRVTANFMLDAIFGDPTKETRATGLGGPIDGVLTEYKALPAHVRCPALLHALVGYPDGGRIVPGADPGPHEL